MKRSVDVSRVEYDGKTDEYVLSGQGGALRARLGRNMSGSLGVTDHSVTGGTLTFTPRSEVDEEQKDAQVESYSSVLHISSGARGNHFIYRDDQKIMGGGEAGDNLTGAEVEHLYGIPEDPTGMDETRDCGFWLMVVTRMAAPQPEGKLPCDFAETGWAVTVVGGGKVRQCSVGTGSRVVEDICAGCEARRDSSQPKLDVAPT